MVFPRREDSGATLALAASVCALSLLAVIVSVCGVISGAMYPELEPVSVVGWEFRLFLPLCLPTAVAPLSSVPELLFSPSPELLCVSPLAPSPLRALEEVIPVRSDGSHVT